MKTNTMLWASGFMHIYQVLALEAAYARSKAEGDRLTWECRDYAWGVT
jgi:hypothetical protein